jgi:hypothetical protein
LLPHLTSDSFCVWLFPAGYSLSLPVAAQITLSANTVYGALKGLETFSQLVDYSEELDAYVIAGAPISIEDEPRFQWRGFMIDTVCLSSPFASSLSLSGADRGLLAP